MIEVIRECISKGAKLYASISGGKDGQAMVKVLLSNGFAIDRLVHADLGRVEWPESLPQCHKLSQWHNIPLATVTRRDGRDLLAHWANRMQQVQGQGKPFWSSSTNRYCTSDMKRDPINVFFTSTGEDFIISCEGIRADESTDRAEKSPLSIRWRKTSTYYKGMTVDEAIAAYTPGKKLALDWYPIFNFTVADVWATYGMTPERLSQARAEYQDTGLVPVWWPFHPAYTYGNDRLSCMFCVLGSRNDLGNAARHNPELLQTLVSMEDESGYTFKKGFSLKQLTA